MTRLLLYFFVHSLVILFFKNIVTLSCSKMLIASLCSNVCFPIWNQWCTQPIRLQPTRSWSLWPDKCTKDTRYIVSCGWSHRCFIISDIFCTFFLATSFRILMVAIWRLQFCLPAFEHYDNKLFGVRESVDWQKWSKFSQVIKEFCLKQVEGKGLWSSTII